MRDAVLNLEQFMDEAFNDPIVQAVMRRDRVTEQDVWQLMKRQQKKWIMQGRVKTIRADAAE